MEHIAHHPSADCCACWSGQLDVVNYRHPGWDRDKGQSIHALWSMSMEPIRIRKDFVATSRNIGKPIAPFGIGNSYGNRIGKIDAFRIGRLPGNDVELCCRSSIRVE